MLLFVKLQSIFCRLFTQMLLYQENEKKFELEIILSMIIDLRKIGFCRRKAIKTYIDNNLKK